MYPLKYKTHFSIALIALIFSTSCTKLDQGLNSTLTSDQAKNALGVNGTQLLLQTAYNDVGNPYSDPGNIMSMEEVTADQCVVPTRAGDWDDNGKWRALKQQTFKADGVDVIINMFNALNKLNFDATNVLAFNPSKAQAAEARFLRAFALYQLLDLFGQFPFRDPGDNLLNAPKVYTGDSAVNFIIDELNTIIPDLDPANGIAKANKDAANMLLMKLYLNRGAFNNRAAPTFNDADMQQVITLGNAIIASGKYAYNANYFDNFSPSNSGSKEAIFAYPNTSGVATNNSGIHNYWWATLHYNSYRPLAPQSGWNGFSTVADFYNSFGVTSTPTKTPADTLLDQRIGGRFYKGCTDVSGIRPGLLIGQQYYEDGTAEKDRKGNLLKFDPNISADLKETGNDLEIKGIRIVKYVPDFSGNGKNYGGGVSGNWAMIYRYPDVVLMVAEAKMRATAADNAGALALVNELRTARKAAPLASMTLVNPSNVADPGTLLAERGRELYWESTRRTDLIRFGVFMKPWALKPASDEAHLLFPIPTSALAANPNLKQNTGY
ncbi:MAG: RagB/SusD family nutrient uptake outer membrane protein [Ferruginibacter sp.]|uniref:RagB/SusD family nutrient uptake outer membrane protein n=1 Tax=Ferruginibacter sp. TaxID=1940288 RepID=UPI002657CBEA|nr:RagB/SusD family nutrient uptake outer membrane protein [Ferruginibacter sp.]MDB5275557.1 RagB/SusD family nutrient uptake outer membrane protein [Ferruginibacter sp.]